MPRQADRAPLPASLNPRGPGAPAPAFTPPAPDVPAAQPGGSGGPGAPIPPGTPGAPRPPRPSNSAWPRKRKIKVGVYATLAALLLTATGTYFWADSKLNHENVLADYKGPARRPARAPTG
ncbi:hypothetical protein GCM10020229_67160 [Kitasatospora albolonga]|uniref:hypothetical protein n=1 Tax=Kitasatospora albolonga TaxID=68173 RepID=UPI0031E85E3D